LENAYDNVDVTQPMHTWTSSNKLSVKKENLLKHQNLTNCVEKKICFTVPPHDIDLQYTEVLIFQTHCKAIYRHYTANKFNVMQKSTKFPGYQLRGDK